jgi:hypothetical protein
MSFGGNSIASAMGFVWGKRRVRPVVAEGGCRVGLEYREGTKDADKE